MQYNFLEKLLVVELANALAGPATGMFFAEQGARVIKIENPATGGDITRSWKLPQEGEEVAYSSYYCSVNYGKEVLMKDLRRPEEREEALALIREADIVISNYKEESARKIGMDYASLSAVNPRLIYGALTGFGAGDPRVAFDVVLQAESGMMYMNGEAEGEPLRLPLAIIDILASHQLRAGLLMAMLQRASTGKGALVKTSLYEAALTALTNRAASWLMCGILPRRMGSPHPAIAPYGDVFGGAGAEPFVLAVATDRQFQALCEVINRPRLAEDPRFTANENRVKNRPALNELLAAVFAQRNRSDWIRLFAGQGVPAGCIYSMEEVFRQDRARKMVLRETMPDGSSSQRVQMTAFSIFDGLFPST